MNDRTQFALVAIGIVVGVSVGMYSLLNFTDGLKNEAIKKIDEDFDCNQAYILFHEAKFEKVRDHIIIKTFKECLT